MLTSLTFLTSFLSLFPILTDDENFRFPFLTLPIKSRKVEGEGEEECLKGLQNFLYLKFACILIQFYFNNINPEQWIIFNRFIFLIRSFKLN